MRIFVVLTILLTVTLTTFAQSIQPPKDFLGFQPGADFKLARWNTIVEYFDQVGERSPRVLVEEKGRTTEDNPYIMATISSPDTIQNVDRYKRYQRLLSHPNEIGSEDKDEILDQAKCVVIVSCSLHSNEIGASQMSMELLYELATREDDEIQEILDNTIILLVPSANPDGIDKVVDWYDRSLGKPWEGQGMPWLYQKYVGHDDNRDWFMITQKETQIMTKVMYEEWYPSVLYDIHQMGNAGLRFFVPPFFDPVNPNVDPLIHEMLKVVGGHMSARLSEEGKTGVVSNAVYDNWWNGGARTTPYRHNIVGLLTEAASPNIASPIFQRKSQLRGGVRGLSDYRPQVNFPEPWDGGWWRLRDVVEYEKIACYALFQVASRYRDHFNRNYLSLGEKALRLGEEEPPYAFLIPPDQHDYPSAIRLLTIMKTGGIDIDAATAPFTANGIEYPKGTYVVYASQPYRNYVRDLLEPQEYPQRYLYPGGPPEPPYDVAGWTLSYQMGVRVVPVDRPLDVQTEHLDEIQIPQGSVRGSGDCYFSQNHSTNDFILLNRAFKNGIPVSVLLDDWKKSDAHYATGTLVFQAKRREQKRALEEWIEELGLDIQRDSTPPRGNLKEIDKPRIGLYYPWAASMDEGWTRFVFEQFEFDYKTVYNADIRAGNLIERYDTIVIPDVGSGTILNGMRESTTAPEFVGGIGDLGVMYLQDFVKEGGRLLCLDSSGQFAIRYFKLPVKNVLAGLPQKEFFCPGSILRIHLKPDRRLTFGMPEHTGAYFARSAAFEIEKDKSMNSEIGPKIGTPEILAQYDPTVTLMSGFIQGESKLQGKGAIVQVPYGKGKVILYGFRVQHRAQTHATFRLLFNGMIY